ncbi:adenylyltransferase/cytidyltransferase family protein [Candidatus Hodarchaeum mangrovi]
MKSTENSTDSFQALLKEFLKIAFLLTVGKGGFSVEDYSKALMRTNEESISLLKVLKSIYMVNTVKNDPQHYLITEGGRKNLNLILTGGVFDILHLGHIKTLEEAAKEGDLLLVVVASDETVERSKGRLPLNNQENRMELLKQLKIVDLVEKGTSDPTKFMDIVIKYKPDVIALGYDQSLTEDKLQEFLADKGLEGIEIIRLGSFIPNEKSSIKIKNLDEHSFE